MAKKGRCFKGTDEEYAAMLKRRGEAIRRAQAKMTPEAKAERIRKAVAKRKATMAALSPEEYAAKFARAHETLRNRTPEQKAEAARKANETRKRHYEAMTPEEREAVRERCREGGRKVWANMTPAKREARLAKVRASGGFEHQRAALLKRFAEMTPEEHEAWYKKNYPAERRARIAQQGRDYRSSLTAEAKKAHWAKIHKAAKRNFAALSPEEQKARKDKRYRTPEHRAKMSQQMKAWLASAAPEEIQKMSARINTPEVHIKAGATRHKRMAKMTKAQRREACKQLHTPETRAKVKASVKEWYDNLPYEEQRHVVAIILAKERAAKKRKK